MVLQPDGFYLLVRGVLQSCWRGWQMRITLPLCFLSETEATLPVFGKPLLPHSCCSEDKGWPAKLPREQKKVPSMAGEGGTLLQKLHFKQQNNKLS